MHALDQVAATRFLSSKRLHRGGDLICLPAPQPQTPNLLTPFYCHGFPEMLPNKLEQIDTNPTMPLKAGSTSWPVAMEIHKCSYQRRTADKMTEEEEERFEPSKVLWLIHVEHKVQSGHLECILDMTRFPSLVMEVHDVGLRMEAHDVGLRMEVHDVGLRMEVHDVWVSGLKFMTCGSQDGSS
ncbi:UNVERIFIED_CONTAM: hypothetical protein FKN15_015581 [Acipenser sinensis]